MNLLFTKEAKIGLITIIALSSLYFGVNYLKGINIFKPTNYYYVAYDNVLDLTPSNGVFVEGFKVGLVNNIVYNYQQNGGKIVVVLDLDKSLRIPRNSKAELTVSMLGTASINLKLNTYVSEYHQPGDTIEGITAMGLMGKMERDILPKMEVMMGRMDSILMALQTVVANPALNQSLTSIGETTQNLAASTKQLNRMLANDVPVMMGNFKTISSNLVGVSDQFNRMDFVATLDSVKQTICNLNQLTNSLNNPNGTIGLLLNDRRLYDNLSSTANSADQLLKDFKERPKRYVHFSIWGSKQQ